MKTAEMSVTLIDSMGSDLSVVNAARVSFHKESELEYYGRDLETDEPIFSLSEKDQKLISYLARHNHWSPFTHQFLSYRVKTPLFIARQAWKSHIGVHLADSRLPPCTGEGWNEVSRRYVDDEPEFWFPKVWRGRPVNAKQGSDGVITDFPYAHIDWVVPEHICSMALTTYNGLLEAGVAPEQARMILPQNMMTEWIWSGSLLFFARFCNQRLDLHAQKEIQEVAQQINNLVPSELQHSWNALLS